MNTKFFSLLGAVIVSAVLAGCSQPFVRPDPGMEREFSQQGPELFNKTFLAHGGGSIADLNDVNLALDGEWKFLITRIQPLVTDFKYRVVSEERLLPSSGVYAAHYTGPAGSKRVFRTRDSIRVFYNGEESFDQDVLASSALTADSFLAFLLGPLHFAAHQDRFVRIDDIREKGKTYQRLHLVLTPGLGLSESDELVLWIDPETNLTYRMHITLEGYKTTKGAHVDVTFLDYVEKGPFRLPAKFHERVLGPLFIDAHSWWLTGMDLNRGLEEGELDGATWSRPASSPATALQEKRETLPNGN